MTAECFFSHASPLFIFRQGESATGRGWLTHHTATATVWHLLRFRCVHTNTHFPRVIAFIVVCGCCCHLHHQLPLSFCYWHAIILFFCLFSSVGTKREQLRRQVTQPISWAAMFASQKLFNLLIKHKGKASFFWTLPKCSSEFLLAQTHTSTHRQKVSFFSWLCDAADVNWISSDNQTPTDVIMNEIREKSHKCKQANNWVGFITVAFGWYFVVVVVTIIDCDQLGTNCVLFILATKKNRPQTSHRQHPHEGVGTAGQAEKIQKERQLLRVVCFAATEKGT